MWRKWFLPRIVWLFYFLLSSTWRKNLRIHPKTQDLLDNSQPILLAHWHGDELAVLHLVKTFGLATMTSTSKDGGLIDFVIHKFGGATSRGSSTRGGVQALKGLVRLIRGGRMGSIAVDGPKGPIYKAKPGVFEISRLTKAHIVPLAASCQKQFVFEKSWNKAILPKPFSTVDMVLGEPIAPIGKDVSAKSLDLAKSLEEQLFDAKSQAGGKPFAAAQGEC